MQFGSLNVLGSLSAVGKPYTLIGEYNGTAIDDSYTKLLMRCDTALPSTLVPIYESAMGRTLYSTAGYSLTTYKFSEYKISNYYSSGAGLTYASDSDDWYFANEDFTIELWIQPDYSTGYYFSLVNQVQDSNNKWELYVDIDGSLNFLVRYGSVDLVTLSSPAGQIPSTSAWYHVAVVRYGNTWSIYNNGIEVATTTQSQTFPDYTGNLQIGFRDMSSYYRGYMQEFRISKGIARWQTTFTPPATPYNGPRNRVLFTVDGNSDVEYMFTVKTHDSYTGSTSHYLYFNTDNTASNYKVNNIDFHKTYAERAFTTTFVYLGKKNAAAGSICASGYIFAKSGGVRTGIVKYCNECAFSSSDLGIGTQAWVWKDTSSNITQLNFCGVNPSGSYTGTLAGEGTAFGYGSNVSVYKKST